MEIKRKHPKLNWESQQHTTRFMRFHSFRVCWGGREWWADWCEQVGYAAYWGKIPGWTMRFLVPMGFLMKGCSRVGARQGWRRVATDGCGRWRSSSLRDNLSSYLGLMWQHLSASPLLSVPDHFSLASFFFTPLCCFSLFQKKKRDCVEMKLK